MYTQEQILDRISELRAEIARHDASALERFPFSFYVECLREIESRELVVKSVRLDFRRRRTYRQICLTWDEATVARFSRLGLANFLKDAPACLEKRTLPATIKRHYAVWFHRMFNDLTTRPLEYYCPARSSSFRRDLMFCCLRSFPLGAAWFAHIRRVNLAPFTGGLGRACLFLWFLIFRTGGFNRFCVIHTDWRYITMIRPERIDEAYLGLAELMRSDSSLRGIYRCTWLLDPQLEQISPHLACYRTVPVQHGAQLFKCRASSSDAHYATLGSPQRRQLIAAGQYEPTAYAYVWPRAAVLRWADQYKRESAEVTNLGKVEATR
jgi:hypothetical protein